MFKKFNEIRAQRKESGKKGFTLVELIVVLVILAILAALLIPALTGYIDKAKEKQIIAETRQCVMAAQTIADEITGPLEAGKYADAAAVAAKKSDIAKLAEVKEANIGNITVNNGKIESLVYTSGDKTCTYTAATATEEAKYEVTETP